MTYDQKKKLGRISDKKLSRLGRRQILRRVGRAGMAGAAASTISAEDISAASSDQVPIVVAQKYKDPTNPAEGLDTVIHHVPADWYDELTHAETVRDRAKFENIGGVVEVGVRPGKFGGRSAFIRVGIAGEAARNVGKSPEEVRSAIPQRIDGIDIQTERVGMPQLGCYESDAGNDIPGGPIVLNKDEKNDGYRNGSATFSAGMYDNGSGLKFATNQHLFAGVDNNTVYHPDRSSDPVAEIYERNCNLDYILADGKNGHSATDEIVGTILKTTRQYTKSGVDELIAQEADVAKRGVRTCETVGVPVESDGYIGPVDGGCSDRRQQVKGTWDFDRGDSGSVAYRVEKDGEAWILSMNAGFDPDNGNAYGFGAYHLHDQAGIYWA